MTYCSTCGGTLDSAFRCHKCGTNNAPYRGDSGNVARKADELTYPAPQQPNGERVADAWNAAYCAGIDADKLPKYLDALVIAARAEGRREAVRGCREIIATRYAVANIYDPAKRSTTGTLCLDRAELLAALDAMEGK